MSRYGHQTDRYNTAAQRHVGILLILLSAFLYSPAGVFTKAVEAGVWSVLFWRGVFAAIAGVLYLLVIRKFSEECERFLCEWRMGLLVVALQAIATATFILAFKLTSVANVALIWATAPVLATAIAWLFFRWRINHHFFVAAMLVLLGNAILVLGSIGGGSLVGDLFALTMTILVVSATILYRYRPTIPTTLPVVMASIVLALCALLVTDPFSAPTWEIILMGMSGATFVMACTCLFEGSKYLAPGETALIEVTEIPWAIILAILFLAEWPSMQTVIGGTIIMAAVLWYQVTALRKG